MNSKYRGIIVKVVKQKNIGFIKPEEGPHQISFHFSVVDQKDRPLLEKYARVKYKYNVKKSKVLKIWVIPKKHQIHNVKYAERNKKGNYLNIGKLVKGVKGLSVQYEHRTVKACIKNLSMYTLQPVENDEVSFINPTRPYHFLVVVKIKRYTGIRSAGECIKYFEDLDGFLNSNNWCKVIEEVCENKAQWDLFGSLEMPFQEDFKKFFLSLLRIINSIMKKSKLFHTPLIQNLLDTILRSKIFWESTIQLQNFMQFLNLDKEQDIFMLFKEFTKSVSKFVPSSLSIMRNFLHAISKSVPSKNIVELMMYNWNLIAKTQVGGSLDEKWCDIPVMITDEELNGDFLYKDKYLSPVKVGIPYLSEDKYMDTYLRLLRAECFSSIQKGILELKRGELDSRDMSVYSEVSLVGHATSLSSFTIAVKFKPELEVRDWNKTQQLMYGNLVCLSTNTNFTEPIWATVDYRDPELLGKENIILLELCDFNSLKPSSIIIHMQCFSKNIWMVESPTYFNSLKPVLKAFQSLPIHDMTLKTEIVFTNGTEKRRPSYITDNVKIILDENMEHYENQLEKTQMEAFKYAFSNRVAVVQGPPGTGKTFLGTKIVEMLLQINRRVLSKNFATRVERLSIIQQSSEESGLAYSDYCKTQEVTGESEKIEYTNKDVEQMQTSWISEDSASGMINLENEQSQLLKCDEQIGDIFTKNIRSTSKDKHNKYILTTNLIKENDKTNSSHKDWEKLGTVSAQSKLEKEIIDIPVEGLTSKLDMSTTKNTEMKEISLPDLYSANNKKDCHVEDRGGRGLIKIGNMRNEIFECSLSNNQNKQTAYTPEILMGETTDSKTGFCEAKDNVNHVKESTVGVTMQQEVQDKLSNIRETLLSKTFCLESNKKDYMTFENLCSINENSENDTSENKSVEDDLALQTSSVPLTNNASSLFTRNSSSSFIDDRLRPATNFISSNEPTNVTSGSLGSLKQKSSCTSAEDTNSRVKLFADENVHSCSESSNAQLRKNFDEIPLPILLLTYKNHALDEFLLKMIELFGMKSVIRIGGRSKEPKLDECNLSNQFRNILARRTNKNDLFEDYFCIKEEIDKLQEKIDKNMDLLQSATQLNEFSLLQLLDEKQIITLLQKSNLDKDEQWWLQFILDRLYNEGKSVKKCLLDLYKKINLETEFIYFNFNLKKIWERALQDWLPPVPRIRQLREINRKYTKMMKTVQHEDYNRVPSEDEELSDADEDCIRKEQEKRMSESINSMQSKKKVQLKLMKPSDGIICELSDFPSHLAGDHFLKERELWQLDEIERIRFINLLLKAEVKKIKEQFESTLDDLYLKINKKKYLESQIKLDICKKRKIIGMTITGASINSELIQQLAPKIVIVEEAAEILEPSLIAALHEKTEHLILIGDHQQLRPKIDTHELRKKFYFDVSLMERLISSGKIDFKTLQRQCRMRPEFSIMLRDIYPNLKDGESIVLNEDHEQHNCITKSMFFWTHNFFEKKSRSYINKEEAKMVVSLTIYLLSNQVSVDKISILAPYLGQTKILRQKLSQAKKNYPHLIPEVTPQVSTIDMFQGDENDFIIVSLVRSNKPTNKNNIGFMNEMNRRCVTQSRARRGMFFVGNGETYGSSLTWLPLISKMKEEGCYGSELPIQCPKHRDLKITRVNDVETLNRYIDSPDLLCSLPCDKELPCGLHKCQKLCLPLHNHQICTHIVSDKFPDCRHSIMRKCCEELRHLRCQAEIEFSFMCRHLGKRKCWEEYAIKTCKKDCEKVMDCNLHRCKKICGQKHSHLQCEEEVKFTIQRCSHTAIKQCYENPKSVLCQKMVKKKLPCNHTIRIECHKPLPTTCYVVVEYKFPDCSHPSSSKKLCSDEITDVCSHKVKHVCQNCKRISLKECGTPFICKFKCSRKRKCGHQCEKNCSEDCEKGECQVCEKIVRKRFRKAAKRNIKKIREDLFHLRRQQNLVLKEINNEVNAGEYRKIESQLKNYFRSKQDLLPKILKIEKVDNAGLERNFEKAKISSLGNFVDDLFYECDDNDIEHITKNGFPLQENPTVGIHLFTQLAKGGNKQETQSPKKILLCEVLIGKSLKTDSKTKINTDKAGIRPYDSVYLRESNSGKSETFIIFNRNQLFPKYVIHYECVLIPTLTALPDLKTAEGQVTKISVEPSRNQNVSDPRQAHFMKAEAIFYRLQKMYWGQSSTLEIKSIDFVVYPNDFPLKMKFEEKKNELEKGNFTEEILAFHGTDISNVENILNTNLDPHRSPKHGLLYGKGCYFSEFPDFSQNYGKGLILFRVLPGKEFEDETTDETWVKRGYHSKKVRANKDRYAEQIIIQDQAQFLPYCVYHFKYD